MGKIKKKVPRRYYNVRRLSKLVLKTMKLHLPYHGSFRTRKHIPRKRVYWYWVAVDTPIDIIYDGCNSAHDSFKDIFGHRFKHLLYLGICPYGYDRVCRIDIQFDFAMEKRIPSKEYDLFEQHLTQEKIIHELQR